MTKEGIKAVRFCCGYNTDLRCDLKWHRDYETVYAHAINAFLFNNRHGIFGGSFIEKSGATGDFFVPDDRKATAEELENNEKILRFIQHETWQVCSGTAEDK